MLKTVKNDLQTMDVEIQIRTAIVGAILAFFIKSGMDIELANGMAEGIGLIVGATVDWLIFKIKSRFKSKKQPD